MPLVYYYSYEPPLKDFLKNYLVFSIMKIFETLKKYLRTCKKFFILKSKSYVGVWQYMSLYLGHLSSITYTVANTAVTTVATWDSMFAVWYPICSDAPNAIFHEIGCSSMIKDYGQLHDSQGLVCFLVFWFLVQYSGKNLLKTEQFSS